MEDNNFKIILFTAPEEINNEPQILTLCLQNGIDYLHIRKPQYSRQKLGDLIAAIPQCYHHKIKIHDHFSLTEHFNIGVSLNSRNPIPPHKAASIAKSMHSLAELADAHKYQYVTLSPICNSISKYGYNAQNNLKTAPQTTGIKNIIALGGQTVTNLHQTLQLQFAGAALMGDIWTNNNITSLLNLLRRRNMRLQFITNATTPEQTITQALQALKGGCRWIQIRMKNSPAEEIEDVIAEIRPHTLAASCNLIIDDHVEIAAKALTDGVHLGKTDTDPAQARTLLPPYAIIGYTANSIEDLHHSMSLPIDYLGIGPLHKTTTKINAAAPLGIQTYRQIKQNTDYNAPYVAIGGITTNDIQPLMQAGAMGVAVSAAITQADDPAKQTENFINILKQYNNYIKWTHSK